MVVMKMVMTDGTLRHRLSHIIVRTLSTVCLAHFLLGGYSQSYYSVTKANNPDVGLILLILLMASTLILPLYVLFEVFWMLRDSLKERRALAIDAAFVAAWFCTFWGLLFYGVTHTVWL